MTTKMVEFNPLKAELFFERHAWIVILALNLLIGFFGAGDILNGASDLQNGEKVVMARVTGKSWNDLQTESPNVANLIDVKFRMDGVALATIALLSIAICLTGFRKGERWAWISLWVLPV